MKKIKGLLRATGCFVIALWTQTQGMDLSEEISKKDSAVKALNQGSRNNSSHTVEEILFDEKTTNYDYSLSPEYVYFFPEKTYENLFSLSCSSHSSQLTQEEQNILKHNILSFTEKYLIYEEEIPGSERMRKVRNILKFLIPFIIGLTEGVTAIEPSCGAGYSIAGNSSAALPLCVTFSSGTFIALGGAAAWAGLHLVSQFDPVSIEEETILRSTKKCKLPKRILAFSLGTVSTLVPVFLVYKYNSMKWLAIPAFFTNFVFKAMGFHKLIDFLSNVSNQPPCDKQRALDAIMLQDMHKQLVSQLLEDENNESSIINLKSNLKNKLEAFLDYDKNSYVVPSQATNPKLWKNGYPRNITQLTSLIFPIGDAFFTVALAYQALSSVISSPPLCLGGACLAATPGLVLNSWASTSKTGDIFDAAFYKLKENEPKTIASIYYPSLSKLKIFFALTISACYATSFAYLANDTLSDFSFLGVLVYALPAMVFGSHILFGSFTNSILAENIIEKSISLWGSERKRSVLSALQRLENINEFLKAYFSNPIQEQ